MRHIHCYRKAQEKNDAKRKRAYHEQEIFAACFGMVNAQGRLHTKMTCVRDAARWCLIAGTAADRRQRRHPSGTFGR